MSDELKISKCCEVEAVEKDGNFVCSKCQNICELQPREWRWWEDEDGKESSKIATLKIAFSYGATDKEACASADISLTQLYYYQRMNPKFASEKERLKLSPTLEARKSVVDAISHRKATVLDKTGAPIEIDILPNTDLAFRYLERKADDMKPKSSLELSGGLVVETERNYPLEELLKKATPEQRQSLLDAIRAITPTQDSGGGECNV